MITQTLGFLNSGDAEWANRGYSWPNLMPKPHVFAPTLTQNRGPVREPWTVFEIDFLLLARCYQGGLNQPNEPDAPC